MPLKPIAYALPRWALILLSLTSLLALFALWPHYAEVGANAVARPASSDFHKFYVSAQRVRDGLSMYWLVPPREAPGDACHPDTPDAERQLDATPGTMNLGGNLPCLGPNLNPPVFMVLVQPLSLLPYGQAWWMWAAFSAICGAWAAALISGLFSNTLTGRLAWSLILSAGLFTYYPTLTSFGLGQLGLPLLLLLTLSWLCARNGKERQAGAWLGLAIGLKPFLAVLLLGWVVTRRKQAVMCCLLVLAASLVLGAALHGIEAYREYLLVAQNVTWTASNWNGSWFGLFDRGFSGQVDSTWPSSKSISKLLAGGCALLTLATSLWVIARQPANDRQRTADAMHALLIPTALLVSPLGWVYYFPALLISVLASWSVASASIQATALRLLLVLPMALTMTPITLAPVPTPLHPSTWWGIDSLHWYALMLLWMAGLGCFLAKNKAP